MVTSASQTSPRSPLRRDAAASRERLLRAGVALFSVHGPDATSVEMLSAASGLNRRMLYHYFQSKDGLYQAAIQRMYEEVASIEIELAHVLLPAEELLERIIRAYYAFLATHPEFVRLLAWENLRQGQAARAIDVSATKGPIVQALRIALERGKAEGRFRYDVDEKQLLISCMALSFFYFSNQHTLGRMLGFNLMSRPAIEQRVRHVVRLLLEGIQVDSQKEKTS